MASECQRVPCCETDMCSMTPDRSAPEDLVEALAADLLLTDALTSNDEGTPSLYTVHPDDVPHLVRTVLELTDLPRLVREAEERAAGERLAGVEALAAEWEREATELLNACCTPRDVHEGQSLARCAYDLRAALAVGDEGSAPSTARSGT